MVALPHPRRRLHLDDARRVSLLARRFAPAVCLGFEDGAHYPIAGADGRPRHGVLHLGADGAVAELAALMSELARAAESGDEWWRAWPERPRADSMSVLDPVANVVRTELESLRQHALADPGAVDRFVDGRPFPLVEGRTCTFV